MNLVTRAAGICSRPRREWQTIAAEPTPPASVVLRYLLPIAALAAIISIVSLFVRYPMGLGAGAFFWLLARSLAYFILLPIVVCAITAFVINGFATTFHGTPDPTQAFKLAAYSYTPALILLVLMPVLPPNELMAALAVASVAAMADLFFLGSPILMRAPEDRAVPYTMVALVAMYGAAYVLTPLMALAR